MADRPAGHEDTTRDDRAVIALRRVLEPLPDLPPSAPPTARPLPRPGRGRRVQQLGVWAVAASALLAVLLLQVVALVPPAPASRQETAVIPDPFPAYSHVASPLEHDRVGPVLMVFAYGQGVEFMDFPTTVALGADGATYRKVHVAASDTRPFLLSPDGTALAVGTTGKGGRLTVVDLLTGDRQRWTVRKGSSVHPAAWSADGRSVFVTTSGEAWSWVYGPRPRGDWGLHRVDTRSRGSDAVSRLPVDPERQAAVAALPGAGGLLVSSGVTELRDADGVQTLVADAGLPAWAAARSVSPDGRHVAVLGGESSESVTVLPLRDGRVVGAPTAQYAGMAAAVLGWLDDRRVLVGTYDNDTWRMRLHLTALDAITGDGEEVLVAEPGWTGASVTSVSVAADLLRGASVAPVDDVDRGYPYVVARTVAWVLTLVLAHRVWRLWRPRGR